MTAPTNPPLRNPFLVDIWALIVSEQMHGFSVIVIPEAFDAQGQHQIEGLLIEDRLGIPSGKPPFTFL